MTKLKASVTEVMSFSKEKRVGFLCPVGYQLIRCECVSRL